MLWSRKVLAALIGTLVVLVTAGRQNSVIGNRQGDLATHTILTQHTQNLHSRALRNFEFLAAEKRYSVTVGAALWDTTYDFPARRGIWVLPLSLSEAQILVHVHCDCTPGL